MACTKIYLESKKEERKQKRKEKAKNNPEWAKKENKKNYDPVKKKKWREENKDKIKKWREENKQKMIDDAKKYYQKNKDLIRVKRKLYMRLKRKNDPLFNLKQKMRSLVTNSIKNKGFKKEQSSKNIIGCTYNELVAHLENNKFGFKITDKKIDIDHIKPLSTAKTKEDVLALNHFKNLQLLPSKYNQHIKSDKPFNLNHFTQWMQSVK